MENMEKQTLGRMITSLRKARNMTQAQLAGKMNVTDKAVSKWERDLSCPDIDSLPRLAEIFGVSVDELMQGEVRCAAHSRGEQTGVWIGLILRAVALAMGAAVTALSALRELDMYAGLTMLGIGLTCAGLSLFGPDRGESQRGGAK